MHSNVDASFIAATLQPPEPVVFLGISHSKLYLEKNQ